LPFYTDIEKARAKSKSHCQTGKDIRDDCPDGFPYIIRIPDNSIYHGAIAGNWVIAAYQHDYGPND
jgi:hypothetical protein